MAEHENQTVNGCPPGTPQPPTTGFPYQEEEDEINLLDLFLVLLRNKFFIFGFVFLVGAGAVVVSLGKPNIYQSTATIAPKGEDNSGSSALRSLGGLGGMVASQMGLGGGGGTIEKLEMFLKSRYLTDHIVKKYHLLPVIFSDMWDKEKKKWITDAPPTLQDAYQTINGSLSISVEGKGSSLVVGFKSQDPKTAETIVSYYVTELSDILREEVLRDARENMRFFREELEKIVDPLLREKIYAMLATEIEKATFARAQRYYGFLVLDPPFVPDLKRKIGPKRRQTCMLSVIVAFFLAVFLVFIKEYVHRIKREDPERYEAVVEGFKLWKKAKGKT